jgi:antitoxin VapB
MIHLSRETEMLAERLAAAQHLSVEAAIRQALEAQARAAGVLPKPRGSRDQSPEAVTARHTRTDQFVARLAALPILDPRSPSEIMEELNAL